MLEPEAPIGQTDRKRAQKANFKFHNKGGEKAEKMDKKTNKMREKLNDLAASKGGFFKNDLILI